MSLHVGEAIGDYRIIGIIGAGGMGQVFQVEHKITKRKEAMKVLIADLADDTQIQRFKREIEVQARLNHPNIAAVHNAFRLKDRLVLVLEFVEGETLESLLKKGRPQLDTGIDYVRQTLEALSYAHHDGVIHRDVSPANLMITEKGLVKLMDFGVAKSLGDLRLTDGGSMIGSLYYMSPEQVKGSTDPDPRSDIYSAGAILYEIVTGKKPFDYGDRFSLMVAQVEEQPRLPSLVDPEIPAELDDIILKALAKEPGLRYNSAQEFLAALAAFQQAPAGSAPPLMEAPPERRISDVLAGISILVICALAGVGAVAWNRANEPIFPPPVVVAVPPAPPNLAAIPPAGPVSGQPEAVERVAGESVPVVGSKRPAEPGAEAKTAAKHAPMMATTKAEPAKTELKPAETTPAESELAPEAQTSAPRQAEAAAPLPAKASSDTESNQPKKGGFWNRLNPLRAKTIFKKKKDDSALRAPGDTPPVDHR